MELSSSNMKTILIFPEMEPCTSQAPHQILYISGNGSFWL